MRFSSIAIVGAATALCGMHSAHAATGAQTVDAAMAGRSSANQRLADFLENLTSADDGSGITAGGQSNNASVNEISDAGGLTASQQRSQAFGDAVQIGVR